MTIRDFFDKATAQCPERPAQRFFLDGAWRTRTYAELRARVLQVAAAARRLGVAPGRRSVALLLENGPEWEEIYLALACAGTTVVPIDPKLKPREVLHILRGSDAAAVFVGAKQAETIGALSGALGGVEICICVGGGEAATGAVRAVGYEQALADAAADGEGAAAWFEANRPADDTVASLIYTSGTTGDPKGVMLTHANFAADALAAVRAVRFNQDDDFLAVLPFFHTYSFTGNILLPLSQGGCTSFPRSLKTLAEDMKAVRPTVLLAVPLLAEKIYAKVEGGIRANPLARLLLAVGLGRRVGRKVVASLGGRLRFIGIGGAPADRRVLKGLLRLGIPTLEGYGLTECGPLVAYPRPGRFRIGTVGGVLPCMEYKIVDRDGTGAGELCVRGPNVMRGYFRDPAATDAAFDDEGYLRTGDVVRADADGNLAICGRRKALVVNREGKNIYPEEIEQIVACLPYVAESLALGYTVRGEAGERLGLLVEADDDACQALGATRQERDASLLSEIGRICRERLAEYKIPRKILVRHEPFALTSTFKVKRVAYSGILDEV